MFHLLKDNIFTAFTLKLERKTVLYLLFAVSYRFSGVTKEDLTHAEKTIEDVQADFINLFSSETIFVGHSLESDLIALKVSTN